MSSMQPLLREVGAKQQGGGSGGGKQEIPVIASRVCLSSVLVLGRRIFRRLVTEYSLTSPTTEEEVREDADAEEAARDAMGCQTWRYCIVHWLQLSLHCYHSTAAHSPLAFHSRFHSLSIAGK